MRHILTLIVTLQLPLMLVLPYQAAFAEVPYYGGFGTGFLRCFDNGAYGKGEIRSGDLGVTDWVDGWIARRFNQTSQFGMVFDPFVDRALFVVGTGSVLIDGGVPLWFCVCILVREVFVGLMMTIGTLVGMKRFPVSIWGKRYTFLLMTAVPLLLLGTSTHVTADAAWLGGWFLGIPGLVMSYVVGVLYIPVVLRNVRLGRAERALP